MLCRGNLVVLCLGRNAQLPELFVRSCMKAATRASWRRSNDLPFPVPSVRSTEQRAAAEDQVFSLFVEIFVDQEIFLLRADGCVTCDGHRVAEQIEDTKRLC